jgi:prevent-host-death family protein
MNIHEAKTHLSKLLAEVEQGHEVVITRAGTPIAKLVPYRTPARRIPGGWEGRVRIADDFDVVDEELVAGFEGEPR